MLRNLRWDKVGPKHSREIDFNVCSNQPTARHAVASFLGVHEGRLYRYCVAAGNTVERLLFTRTPEGTKTTDVTINLLIMKRLNAEKPLINDQSVFTGWAPIAKQCEALL